MNLKELLLQKISSKKEEEKEEGEVFYSNVEEPPPLLYNLYLSILVKRTYTSILDTRDYLRFLTSPYSFTINAFRQMQHEDMMEIFQTYMTYYPPTCSYHLHALYLTLWDIELKVPQRYKDQVIENIKNEGLAKNSKLL